MHVCLIAEGSYPYVTGGVGKWTHDLIASLPEVEFTVIALWPHDNPEPVPRYPTLPNIMKAKTKPMKVLGLKDLGLDTSALAPKWKVKEMFVPPPRQACKMIPGDTPGDQVKNLLKSLKEEAKVL